MVKATEAIEEIRKAQETGDAGTIGQYLDDDRKTVRDAAEDALQYLSQNDIEDATPELKTPEYAEPLNASAESIAEERERKSAEGHLPGSFRNDADAKEPIRIDEWIEMTAQEAKEYEGKGLLVGYNGNLGMGLLKK